MVITALFGIVWMPPRQQQRRDQIQTTRPTVTNAMSVFTENSDRNGRIISWSGTVLVVYGGSCASCELHSIVPNNLVNGPYNERLVVFTHADIPETWSATHCPPDVRVLSKTPKALEPLAPQWTGRWYIFVDGLIKDYSRDDAEKPHGP